MVRIKTLPVAHIYILKCRQDRSIKKIYLSHKTYVFIAALSSFAHTVLRGRILGRVKKGRRPNAGYFAPS